MNSLISPILVFLCSPHKNGITDRLGLAAAAGIVASGSHAVRIVHTSQYQIKPCKGCGLCLANSGRCVLPPDAAENIFSAMQAASALVFAIPVYFYALPGQFKIFIDRSQKLWEADCVYTSPARKAAVIMVAARKQGDKLFSGALLTLKWFLKPFSFSISESLLLRGLDTCVDLGYRELHQAFALGTRIARIV